MPDQVQREIIITAPARDVWETIIQPDGLEGWLADEVQIDLTPGGDATFREGNMIREGWVEEVSAPPGAEARPGEVAARLAFWWCVDDEPASRVELALISVDESRTRLRVIEARPLELLDLVGIPLGGTGGQQSHGPALLAGAR